MNAFTSRPGPMLPENQLAFSPTEAARLMGVGRTFLYELIASQALKSIKLGKRRLITRSAIEECLRAHSEGGNGLPKAKER